MDDGAAEAHFETGFRGGVEGVVVAIEAVEEGGFPQLLVIQAADSGRPGAVEEDSHAVPERFSFFYPGIGYHGWRMRPV